MLFSVHASAWLKILAGLSLNCSNTMKFLKLIYSASLENTSEPHKETLRCSKRVSFTTKFPNMVLRLPHASETYHTPVAASFSSCRWMIIGNFR